MTTRRKVIEGDDRVLTGTGYGPQGREAMNVHSVRYVIDRKSDLAIEFAGRKIGYGSTSSDVGTTEVTIYVTESGKYVCHVNQKQPNDRTLSRADVFEDPEAALEWLRGSRGTLGNASKAAWLEACKNWEPIEHLARIHVP